MRRMLCATLAFFLLGGLVAAAPPEVGYVGEIRHGNYPEPYRFACDNLDLLKIIYEAGKENPFRMRPKFEELEVTAGIYGDPQCTSGIRPG